MTRHRFSVDGAPRVEVVLPLGHLRVLPGETDVVEVELDGRESVVERFMVTERSGVVRIEPDRTQRVKWSGVDVTVWAPDGIALQARVTSGDIDVRIPTASLEAETASADLVAGDVAGEVMVRSASGDIRLGDVGSRFSATTASGDVRLGAVEEADIKTASGEIGIGEIRGRGILRTVSGDVDIRRFGGVAFEANSLSGDVSLGVAAGRRYEVGFSTLSGDIRTDFPVQGSGGGAPGTIDITTVSGDIRITRG